ncbi:MAG: DegT/DnrJ/EryC1/StrS family aminotransferase [Anaerolineae bacterium]
MKRASAAQIGALVSQHQLRTLTGRSQVVLCGRASAAIQAALTVIGAQNRPVLIPANTCYIVLWAVIRAGAQPVLVDIDPATGNITPETLAAVDINHPAAVIPCHLYGIPAPMQAITAWARERGAFVIEDAALALGAVCEDKPAGSHGDLSIFSFGTGKIIDVGLGGAALTNDAAFADELRHVLDTFPVWTHTLEDLSDQWAELYFALHRFEQTAPVRALYPPLFDRYGETTAYRVDRAHWRMLADALDDAPVNFAHRRALAAHYDEAFVPLRFRSTSALYDAESPVTVERPEGAMLWRYPLFVPPIHREAVLKHVWASGITEATCWYPSLQAMRAALCPDLPITSTPHADLWGQCVINLPNDPATTFEDAARAAAVFRGFW